MFKKLIVSSAFAFTLVTYGNVSSETQAQSSINETNLLPEPPIWSITDEDSEIILYPTFHILPENINWQSTNLISAINRAGEVWYELPVGADSDPALQRITMSLGLSPDRPLSKVLTGETYDKLSAASSQLGLPIQSLEPMRPWLVSITLPVMQMMQAGYDPQLGVEKRLQSIITNKPTKFFETAEQQIRFFADMSEDDQIDMLESTLDYVDLGQAMITKMAEAWANGDIDTLERFVVSEMKTDYPKIYDIMFTQRNKAWAEALDQEMQGSGVDFVAVGAGHLIGEDSVPQMLLEKGYKVEIITRAPQ